MLSKSPKPAYKRYLGIAVTAAFAVEIVGIAVTYGVWYKLNSERDFRYYMRQNYNWVLEGYYTVGEQIGNKKTRELDLKVWTNEGKI